MKRKGLRLFSLCLVCAVLLSALAVLTGCGKREGVDDRYDGTYFYYAGGSLVRSTYITLEGGKWTSCFNGQVATGAYRVENGEIFFVYTVNKTRDQAEMERYDLKDGQSVPLFDGVIEKDELALNAYMGEALGYEMLFYRDGGTADTRPSAGTSSVREGTYYYYKNGRVDWDHYLRLSEGRWVYSGEYYGGGSYRISGNRITLLCTVDSDTYIGMLLITRYGKYEGQTVELYSGSVSDGRVTLYSFLDESLSEALVYYLDGGQW